MDLHKDLILKYSRTDNKNLGECYNICGEFIKYYNSIKNDKKEEIKKESIEVYFIYSEICCRLGGGLSNEVGKTFGEKETLLYNEAISSLKLILTKDPFDEKVISFYKQVCLFYCLNKRTNKNTEEEEDNISLSILKHVLFHEPYDPYLHYYIAMIFQKKNDLDNSIMHFQTAVKGLESQYKQTDKNNKEKINELIENISKIYNSIGTLYYFVQNRETALIYFNKGLEYYENIDLYNQIGVVYTELRYVDKALFHYNKAIEKIKKEKNGDKKMLSNIYMNKGLCHCYECDFETAIESYNTALMYNPKQSLAFQNKLLDINYISHLIENPMYIPDLHKKINRLYPKVVTNWKKSLPDYKPIDLKNTSSIDEFKNLVLKTKRKLKVGFVSGDFICHPVSYFLTSILKGLDANTYEIYGYTQKVIDLKGIFPKCKFFITKNLNPQQLFDLIKSHGIDILFDMSGQTGDNRLDTFCLKPAPIQISYCGYPGTTGLNSIDYHITDRYCDSEKTQKYYSEKLIFMDHCFLNYEPPLAPPAFPDDLEQPFIKNGYITFGCFNRFNKMNKELIEVWEEILEKIPNARFVIKTKEFLTPHLLKKFKSLFKNQKILERVQILDYSDTLLDHLPDYNLMDVALDTFPYSGTTTSCEALMMGVPVLTLYDSEKMYHVQNVTTSLVINSDLEYFVAKTKNEYVQKAINLSNKPIEYFTKFKKHSRQKFLEGWVWKKEPFIKEFEEKLFTIYKNHNW
jgi:protein O-GlcNAc transferase